MKARWWLLTIFTTVAVGGFLAGFLAPWSQLNQRCVFVGAMFPIEVLAFAWMSADARAHGTNPPTGAAPLLVYVMPLAVLYHLLATRVRWRKLVALVCWSVSVVVALLALTIGQRTGVALAT